MRTCNCIIDGDCAGCSNGRTNTNYQDHVSHVSIPVIPVDEEADRSIDKSFRTKEVKFRKTHTNQRVKP